MSQPLTVAETPDGLVDASAFVAEWWQNAVGRRLSGENGGFTAFAIRFRDGCQIVDYTQRSVFERVSELVSGSVDVWRGQFVAERVKRIAHE